MNKPHRMNNLVAVCRFLNMAMVHRFDLLLHEFVLVAGILLLLLRIWRAQAATIRRRFVAGRRLRQAARSAGRPACHARSLWRCNRTDKMGKRPVSVAGQLSAFRAATMRAGSAPRHGSPRSG